MKIIFILKNLPIKTLQGMNWIKTLKITFGCLILFPALAVEKTKWEMTTLDNWQKADIIALVEVDSFLEIPEEKLKFTKLKAKESWSQKNRLKSHTFYILNSHKKEDIGKLFIGAYSWKTIYKSYYEKSLNDHLNTKNNVYLHSRFDLRKWPVLKDSSEKLYIPGCIDGFTKKPLIDPSLKKLKNLAIPVIDKKTTRIKPKLCKHTKRGKFLYKFLRFLKSFLK